MSSARLGARGLGGKKTELTANRFHAAQPKHDLPLRRALDDKLAKLRHIVKKMLCPLSTIVNRANKKDNHE
jgi:hypothetical protein